MVEIELNQFLPHFLSSPSKNLQKLVKNSKNPRKQAKITQ